jgi:DNA-binding MarR family transcriptional regulator
MEAEIVASLSDTTRLIRRAFDAKARAIGVTRPQWQVLTLLRRNDGINQGGLAELLEAELVERRADPSDRRTWRLHLTAKAEALIVQLRPLADELFDDAFVGLDQAERAQLLTVLDRIRQNLSRKPEAPLVSHG